MHSIPSIYANDELYSRLKDGKFFGLEDLTPEIARTIKDLIEADTLPESFKSLLASIKQSAAADNVKVAINDYAYCLHLSDLLSRKDKN